MSIDQSIAEARRWALADPGAESRAALIAAERRVGRFFAVFSGEYADREMVALFDNETEAKELAELASGDVEEFSLGHPALALLAGRRYYGIGLLRDGRVWYGDSRGDVNGFTLSEILEKGADAIPDRMELDGGILQCRLLAHTHEEATARAQLRRLELCAAGEWLENDVPAPLSNNAHSRIVNLTQADIVQDRTTEIFRALGRPTVPRP